jgi:hypothetical protein
MIVREKSRVVSPPFRRQSIIDVATHARNTREAHGNVKTLVIGVFTMTTQLREGDLRMQLAHPENRVQMSMVITISSV